METFGVNLKDFFLIGMGVGAWCHLIVSLSSHVWNKTRNLGNGLVHAPETKATRPELGTKLNLMCIGKGKIAGRNDRVFDSMCT